MLRLAWFYYRLMIKNDDDDDASNYTALSWTHQIVWLIVIKNNRLWADFLMYERIDLWNGVFACMRMPLSVVGWSSSSSSLPFLGFEEGSVREKRKDNWAKSIRQDKSVVARQNKFTLHVFFILCFRLFFFE